MKVSFAKLFFTALVASSSLAEAKGVKGIRGVSRQLQPMEEEKKAEKKDPKQGPKKDVLPGVTPPVSDPDVEPVNCDGGETLKWTIELVDDVYRSDIDIKLVIPDSSASSRWNDVIEWDQNYKKNGSFKGFLDVVKYKQDTPISIYVPCLDADQQFAILFNDGQGSDLGSKVKSFTVSFGEESIAFDNSAYTSDNGKKIDQCRIEFGGVTSASRASMALVCKD